MRKTLEAFIRELQEKAAQNEADAEEAGPDIRERAHAQGFASAQRWAAKRLKEILKRGA